MIYLNILCKIMQIDLSITIFNELIILRLILYLMGKQEYKKSLQRKVNTTSTLIKINKCGSSNILL